MAELAGIGVDWYIRLEQGRTVSPSVTTVDALARALRLGKAEHAHLRAIVRNPDRRAFARESVPDAIRRLVERLDQPACVTGRRWDVLAWNKAAAAIFADFGRMDEADRNILLYMLTEPDTRRLFGSGWAAEARRMVAQFRTTHDLWAGDPPSSTSWSGFDTPVPNSRSGGRRTTSAMSHPAGNCWTTRRLAGCASSMRAFRPMTIPRSSW